MTRDPCPTDPGTTHYAGCACWEASIRLEARNQALEEALETCAEALNNWASGTPEWSGAAACMRRIRALKSKP